MTHKLTRLLALMLAVVMTVSMLLVPVEAASFTDVKNGAWYAEAVEYVNERGWMAGVSETSFAPNAEVTRGMMVTVLARLADAETDNDIPVFADTAAGKWYTGAAAWAAEQNIVAGIGSGRFAPSRAITRQDLCLMLYGYIQAMGVKLADVLDRTFSDMESVSDYAREAVYYCTGTGLVAGFDDSTFRPKDTATRAQLAQILMRLDLLILEGNAPSVPMPAQSFDGEAGDDLSVSVDAPKGALPENTEMTVSRVTDEATLSLIQAGVCGSIMVAANITFSKDGEELEPERNVQVQIEHDGLANAKNPRVVHVKADGSLELVSSALVSTSRGGDKAIRFEAKDFSVYAIVDDPEVDTNRNRLRVRFFASDDAATPFYEVMVNRSNVENDDGPLGTNGEPTSKNYLYEIIADPAEPELTDGQLFCGWYHDSSNSANYTKDDVDGLHTMNAIREGITARLLNDTPIANGETYDVYPMIFNYYFVSFVDENADSTLDSTAYYSKPSEGATFSVKIMDEYTPMDETNYRFTGWRLVGTETIYQNGDTVALSTGANVFRATVERGFWITFEENPGEHYSGATYSAPVFCPGGEIPDDFTPTTPYLAGYNFLSWSRNFTKGTDASGDNWSDPFNFETTHTISGSITFYAEWDLKDTVPYTLVVSTQNINDDRTTIDPGTGTKTYDYLFSVTLEAAPNTVINVSNLDLSYYTETHTVEIDGRNVSGYLAENRDGTGEKYNMNGFSCDTTYGAQGANGKTKIEPNGTTVVNIHWDREIVRYTFYKRNTDSYVSGSDFPSANATSAKRLYFTYNSSTSSYRLVSYYSDYYCYYYYATKNEYSSGTTQYGVVSSFTNNELYGIIYPLSWRTENGVQDWYYQSGGSYKKYDGVRFLRSSSTLTVSSNTFYYFSYDYDYYGLYEQPLSKYDDEWDTSCRWNLYLPATTSFLSLAMYLDADYTFYWSPAPSGANAKHYLMDENGNYPSSANYTIPCETGNGMVFRSFTGFYSDAYRVQLPSSVSRYYIITGVSGSASAGYTYTYYDKGADGTDSTGPYYNRITSSGTYWTDWIPSGYNVYYDYTDSNNSTYEPYDLSHIEPHGGTVEFRYARKTNSINYLYGAFWNGKDEPVENPPAGGTIKNETGVYYNSSLNAYAKGQSKYFDPTAALNNENYVFDGWYSTPNCAKGTEYDFTGKNMELNGVTVYARFRLRELRFYLDPCLPDGTTVTWSDASQSLCFRRNYGDVVSDGQMVRGTIPGYTLAGWYLDPEYKIPYSFTTRVSSDIAEPYDWDVDYTEFNDQTLDPPTSTTNKDKTNNRFWITEKITIYAKWRETLNGAAGINVVYDAGDGEGTIFQNVTYGDPLKYNDGTYAIATSAAEPDDTTKFFQYWQVMTPASAGSSTLVPGDQTTVPGMDFMVNIDDAVVTQNQNPHVHSWAHIPATANCGYAGKSEIWYCFGCHEYYTDSTGATVDANPGHDVAATGNHTLQHFDANVPVSCTEGNREYWRCTVCGKYFSDANAATEVTEDWTIIVGDSHDWGERQYVWTETADGWSCTASVVCQTNSAHTRTETVDASYAVTTQPGPNSAGVGTYTATFTNSLFTTQTKTITLEPTGVNYTVTYSVYSDETVIPAVTCNSITGTVLPAATPENGQTFLGWVTAECLNTTARPDPIYEAGDTYKPASDITLYALFSFTESTASYYQLLTALPSDLTGNYVISSGTNTGAYMMAGTKGTYYGNSNNDSLTQISASGATLDGDKLYNVPAANVMTMAASSSSGYYTIVNSQGYYVGDSSYGLTTASSESSYRRWAVTLNSNGTFKLVTENWSGYWMYYDGSVFDTTSSSSNSGVYLWKEVEGEDTTYYTTGTPHYAVTYMVNGTQVSSVSVEEDAQITVGSGVTVNAPSGYTFTGYWVTETSTGMSDMPANKYEHNVATWTVDAPITFHALFSYEDTANATTAYELVTSSQSDWSGKYVISYGKTSSMYVLAGSSNDETSMESTTYAKTLSAAGISLSDNKLYNVSDNYVFNAFSLDGSAYAGYYVFENVGTSGYPALYKASSYSNTVIYNYISSDGNYYLRGAWKPTYSSTNGNVTLINYYYSVSTTDDYPYISFSTSNHYFWSGSSDGTATSQIYLWKETTTAPVVFTTSTGSAGATYTVTAQSNNTSYGTVSISANTVNAGDSVTITASPKSGFTYADPAYTVTTGSAAVTRSGNTFTVTPTTNCSVTINFAQIQTTSYNVNYVVNGSLVSTTPVNSGTNVVVGQNQTVTDPTGLSFTGYWVASEGSNVDFDTVTKYAHGSATYPVTADVTFYALFETITWTQTSLANVTAGVYALLTPDYHAFNGTISSGRGQVTSSTFSFTNGVSNSAPSGVCELTLTSTDYGFNMYNADHGYLIANRASEGYLAWSTSTPSSSNYNLSWRYYSSNWVYFNNDAYLRTYNNATFRTYSRASNSAMSMAKKNTTYTTGSTYNGSVNPTAITVPTRAAATHTVNLVDWDGTIYGPYTVADGGSLLDTVHDLQVNRGAFVRVEGDNEYTFMGFDTDITNVRSSVNANATFSLKATNVYTVTLQAVYGERQPEITDSYITWFGNGGVFEEDVYTQSDYPATAHAAVANEDTELQVTDLRINEGISIPNANKISREGYTFLGWAKIDVNADGQPVDENGDVIEDFDFSALSEDDLFLKYDAVNNAYMAKVPEHAVDAQWRYVDQVAADELQPYNDLYAVWRSSCFYVFHSATGRLEAYSHGDTVQNGGTFDLQAHVTSGYLYGGYYTSYGALNTETQDDIVYTVADLVALEFEQSNATYELNANTSVSWNQNYAYGNTPAYVDLGSNNAVKALTGFEPYTGASAKISDGSKRFWTRANAYGYGSQSEADAGTALTPEVGKVYYVKEVPATFLTTKVAWTYDLKNKNQFIDVFELTAVDDSYYDKIGFRFADGEDEAGAYGVRADDMTLRDALTTGLVLVQGDVAQITLNPATCGAPGGYLAFHKRYEGTASVVAGTETVLPTWETYDHVTVSNYAVCYNINEAKDTITVSTFGPYDGTKELYVDFSKAIMGDGKPWLGNDEIGLTYCVAYFFDSTNAEDGTFKAVQLTVDYTKQFGHVTIPAGSWRQVILIRKAPNSAWNEYDPFANSWGQSADLVLHRSENEILTFAINGAAGSTTTWGHNTPPAANP